MKKESRHWWKRFLASGGENAGSLYSRYLYKVGASAVFLGAGAFTQLVVPRALGPDQYGNLVFLSSFFSTTTSILDGGTSSYLAAQLSRKENPALSAAYWVFVLLGGCFLVLLTSLAFSSGLREVIWPGQSSVFLIFLCMTLAYLLWIVQIQGRIADALGKTKISESLGIIFKLFLVVTFAALFVSQELGIRSIVTLQIALLFPQIVTVAILIPTGLSHLREVAFEGLVSHLKGFARGTGLVFFSSALLVFTNLLDRWLLQRFAGSTEQGYFGFAHQLGNLCFLFAAALLPLVQREFSLAHASGGDAEVLKKCKMFAPIALIIVSFVACFLVANAKIVLSLVAGNSFLASEATVVIALLHAVFQVFVQIYISLLFSLNQTRTYSVIFAVQALLGIPVSLLILAPHRFGGFEAGAFGLSLKCFVSQLIALNFGLFLSMRKLGGKFGPYLLLQVTTPALCLILGFSAGIFSPAKHTPWLHFILSGILYSGAVLCIAIRWPQAFFLERRVLAQPIEWVQRRLGFGAKVV